MKVTSHLKLTQISGQSVIPVLAIPNNTILSISSPSSFVPTTIEQEQNLGEVTVAPLHKRAFKSSVRAVPIVGAIARMQAGRPLTTEQRAVQ